MPSVDHQEPTEAATPPAPAGGPSPEGAASGDTKPAAPARAVAPRESSPPVGADEIFYAGIAKHSVSLGSYLLWLVVCVFGGVFGWLLMRIESLAELPLWLLSLVGLPMLLVAYLRHTSTKYKITGRRIECERGILSKRVDSLELWRVLDVRYEQSLLDRIFGNGKITLMGTDRTDPSLTLHGLPGHRQLFERLRDAIQTRRMTSRPMELVGQGEGVELIGEGL